MRRPSPEQSGVHPLLHANLSLTLVQTLTRAASSLPFAGATAQTARFAHGDRRFVNATGPPSYSLDRRAFVGLRVGHAAGRSLRSVALQPISIVVLVPRGRLLSVPGRLLGRRETRPLWHAGVLLAPGDPLRHAANFVPAGDRYALPGYFSPAGQRSLCASAQAPHCLNHWRFAAVPNRCGAG